jgi:hypothetical protein
MKPLCRKVCFGLRLALFALTVPLALAAVMLIWQDHNSRRDAIITQVELKSAQVNAQLEDFVHRIDAATAVFASRWVSDYEPDNPYPAELAEMNSSLLRLANDRPEFSAASITDTRGVVIAASDASIIGTRIDDDPLYERATATGKFIASDVFVQEDGTAAPTHISSSQWHGTRGLFKRSW